VASLACVVAVVGAGILPAERAQSAPGQPVEGTWQIVPSPNGGAQVVGNTLWSVDALSPASAWAVGVQPNQSQYLTAPLVIRWDGAVWSVVSTPTIDVINVKLNSVDAIDGDDAWAVGYSDAMNCGLCAQTLIEHWDGTSWSVVPSPNPGWANQLYGVAAASETDVWAVGDQWLDWSTKIPLILHHDGATWTVADAPPIDYGELASVFALAEEDVWAVGVSGVISTGIEALALHWDGEAWTRVPFPTERGGYIALRSVSGVASDDVWAVGVYKYLNWQGHYLSNARTYHWDGTSWTSVLPGVFGVDSRMYDVHAIAADDAWAVGGEPGPPGSGIAFRYVTVHWDGVSWSNVDTPDQGILYSVSASSDAEAWAVGFGLDDLGYSTGTYTLHYTVAGGCPADIDGSGAVDAADLLELLPRWGPCPGCDADLNADGVVDPADLIVLLSAWGSCA
jgi:hypothetical protein